MSPTDTLLVTNLKKHFAKYHKTDYQKILEKQKKRFKNIKEINHIQRKEKEKPNIITTQNNIQEILSYNSNKYYAIVQDEVNDNTINEIKEIIETG
ncbi:22562_t:CDS:2 [Cetraspora pellucida]|uniref:22562_t:CDS:1 n=1 Tax=Cetraspora pellucida TaxID=1433469 RepID=A0A9N9J4V4_9GLOM|nr:22562_t:CDS:2 [Cetraspora pellucida]